jgi:hypothetical protein
MTHVLRNAAKCDHGKCPFRLATVVSAAPPAESSPVRPTGFAHRSGRTETPTRAPRHDRSETRAEIRRFVPLAPTRGMGNGAAAYDLQDRGPRLWYRVKARAGA